jgi:hypothetical protein
VVHQRLEVALQAHSTFSLGIPPFEALLCQIWEIRGVSERLPRVEEMLSHHESELRVEVEVVVQSR